MLTLYIAKGTAALAPHLALQEAGLDYTTRLLDFAKAEHQTDDYAAINPKLRVPALLTGQGILTETPAILAYIAQIAPDAALAPTDPFGFARVQEFNAYLCATVHVNHAHKHRGARWSDDPATHAAMTAKVCANMTASADLIEQRYLTGPWVMGDSFSISDIYLFVVTRWMIADGVDIAPYPKLGAHFAAMQERDAVQKVMPLHV